LTGSTVLYSSFQWLLFGCLLSLNFLRPDYSNKDWNYLNYKFSLAMKLHKEGYKVLPWVILVLALIDAIFFLSAGKSILFICCVIVSMLLLLCGIWFFRDPQTIKPELRGSLLSVADGEVVAIESTLEGEYFKDNRIQVSVFMSVFDVHINHVPIPGEIVYQKHHEGKFLPANLAKSSGGNERCSTVIRTEEGSEILIRQIAGILARRIVTYKKSGDCVTLTDQLGFIRFGSRVDLFFPLSARIEVSVGQKVKGGITVIAKL
jgi:phosphatidylserine decarboxylase